MRAAEAAIKSELSFDLALAQEHRLLNRCMTGFLDRLEEAVVAGDARKIQRLRALKPPLPGRPWPHDTWTAALNNQVSDHISDSRVTTYSRAFLRIGVQREFMQEMENIFPVALSGAFAHATDPGVIHDQIVAIEKLRSLEARRLMIGDSLLTEDGPALGIGPSDRFRAGATAAARRCARDLAAVGTAG